MDFSATSTLLLASGAIGFGVYCLSCALHVWKKRNAKVQDAAAPVYLAWKRFTVAVLVCGLVTMAAGVVLTVAIDSEGVLVSERLLTVRLPDDFRVGRTSTAAEVESGAVLAQFENPERESRIDVLSLKQNRLQTEKELLQNEPLQPDPEITRKIQDVSADQRHLESKLNELIVEQSRVKRGEIRDVVAQRDKIKELQVTSDSVQKQLTQARAELELKRSRWQRLGSLRAQKAVSDDEIEELRKQLSVNEAEVDKFQRQLENLREQKRELQQGLEQLLDLTEHQTARSSRSVADLKDDLEHARRRRENLGQQLEMDLVRAERHRQKQLEKLDIEAAQTSEELAGLKESLRVTAPFAGRIVHRNASPQAAAPNRPLLVLAPESGFQLRVRLPTWEAELLEDSGPLRLQLVPLPAEVEQKERPFVERRFSGRLKKWDAMPHETGRALVELNCEPPAEAVRAMARGEEVRAKLVWWAPFFYHPVFVVGAVLVGCGGLLRTLFQLLQPASPTGSELSGARLSPQRTDGVLTEFGGEGAMLRALGSQIRHSLAVGSLDEHVVAAAEWAVDRHRARAIRLIRDGLGDEREVCDLADVYVTEVLTRSNGHHSNGNLQRHTSAEKFNRLLNVLRVLVGDVNCERIAELQDRVEKTRRRHDGRRGTPIAKTSQANGMSKRRVQKSGV